MSQLQVKQKQIRQSRRSKPKLPSLTDSNTSLLSNKNKNKDVVKAMKKKVTDEDVTAKSSVSPRQIQ